MGWLRDLMSTGEPGLRSFGALARATLASNAWGDAQRPQSRSLAALFSKLDRRIELDWLAERPHVQLALADVLRCPVSDVREALEAERPEQPQALGTLRLDDLRYARPVDLENERPCPGIPPPVLEIERHDALWWIAPPGAGKTFAGRWLRARNLALHIVGERAESLGPALSARRPLFIEFDSTHQWVPRHEITVPICVAAPGPPADPTNWSLVETPPVSTFIDDLIDWVAERLPGGGHFDAERARHWFRGGPLDSGVVDSLGVALGLCGALDEEGFSANSTPRILATRAFARRITELTARDVPDAAWLRRNGFEVLVGLGRRLLTDTTDAWNAARPLENWLALVPPEHQREVDLDWLRTTLGGGESGFRDQDVQRAARRLPPGAYRIVRGLRAAGVLHSVANDRFALRPLWLGRVVVDEAQRQLVSGSPFEYGEALLAPQSAPGIIDALYARIRGGDTSPLEEVTELDAEANPAHVAALEALVCCAGRALLAGCDLSAEPLEALWHEQARLLVRRGDARPARRIAHHAPTGSLLHETLWHSSLLAITEVLDTATADPWFAPWRLGGPPPQLETWLDAVHAELASYSTALACDCYALVDRLRQALGELRSPAHPLEAPAALLDAAELGVLSWELVAAVKQLPWGTEAVRELARRRRQAWPHIAANIWGAWAASSAPVSELPWLDLEDSAGGLWPFLPLELLNDDTLPRLDVVCASPLDDDQLAHLVANCHQLPTAAHTSLWETLPSSHLVAALAQLRNTHAAAASVLWARFTAELLPLLPAIAPRVDLGPLLEAAPMSATGSIVEQLSKVPRDALSDPALEALRDWLWSRVAVRAPEFSDAYGLLAEIERDLRHARGLG